MKRIMILTMMFVMIISNVVFAGSGISVLLNGNPIAFDVAPQIIDGRTMVPIRAIFESMGAVVEWDAATSSAICTKDNTVVKMTVNSNHMYINNQLSVMDTAPVVINGRTLAPARYVAEAFGAQVNWDAVTNTVVISSEKMITLYALDGRTISVPESNVDAHLKVGWYRTLRETQQVMYAADGRMITVYKSQVPSYKNVGWYETQAAAMAANKPKSSTPSSTPSSTTSSTANSTYNPTANGNYYRTPTGKRYHLDPNCGGKNSYKTNNISGLSPCAKCAK